jgi:hypothetical protein
MIVVDYFVVMIVLQVQAALKHYLVGVEFVAGWRRASSLNFRQHYFELQRLPLAFAAFSFSSSL